MYRMIGMELTGLIMDMDHHAPFAPDEEIMRAVMGVWWHAVVWVAAVIIAAMLIAWWRRDSRD
jgi:hypothetical protein